MKNAPIPEAFLIRKRPPQSPFERQQGAEVVFIRQTDDGKEYVIFVARNGNGFRQWNAPDEVLEQNELSARRWREQQS